MECLLVTTNLLCFASFPRYISHGNNLCSTTPIPGTVGSLVLYGGDISIQHEVKNKVKPEHVYFFYMHGKTYLYILSGP